jgi:integrase
MSKRRDYGSGAIEPRGEGSWRLRYRVKVNGKSKLFRKTVKGTKSEATKELLRLLNAGLEGTHVAPDKLTLRVWADQWLSVRPIGQRTRQRYDELLRLHILPVLGDRPLQQIDAAEIDALYSGLKGSAGTKRYVHIVLSSCLAGAVRKRKISHNPMLHVDHAPRPAEGDHGMVLEADQLRALVQGFRSSSLFLIVAAAAFTGARRNEILALRWSDLDVAAKTLRIERAIDGSSKHGLRLKDPKTERGKRTIAIGNELLELLLAERDKHLRIVAGVPDGVDVDLSLVRLPEGSLMFPSPPARGQDFSFTALRTPKNVTEAFVNKAAALGHPGLRFHDLRGTHATLLLDQGKPVHAVAARLGHDAAVLLKAYAKRTRKADADLADAIDNLAKGALS